MPRFGRGDAVVLGMSPGWRDAREYSAVGVDRRVRGGGEPARLGGIASALHEPLALSVKKPAHTSLRHHRRGLVRALAPRLADVPIPSSARLDSTTCRTGSGMAGIASTASNVLVPDLAGWRRERMPELPQDQAYLDLAPDWVCEVISPSTAALDRGKKRLVYANQSIKHLWLVDLDAQLLEVFELDGTTYRLLNVHSGEERVRAVPFEAIELELGALWAR